MAKITIEDAEKRERKKVDSSGKLYLGKDYADREVCYVIEEVEDDE